MERRPQTEHVSVQESDVKEVPVTFTIEMDSLKGPLIDTIVKEMHHKWL